MNIFHCIMTDTTPSHQPSTPYRSTPHSCEALEAAVLFKRGESARDRSAMRALRFWLEVGGCCDRICSDVGRRDVCERKRHGDRRPPKLAPWDHGRGEPAAVCRLTEERRASATVAQSVSWRCVAFITDAHACHSNSCFVNRNALHSILLDVAVFVLLSGGAPLLIEPRSVARG